MKFQLTITKDILKRSAMCGAFASNPRPLNCAFALAFNELVPNVWVKNTHTIFLKKVTEDLPWLADFTSSNIVAVVENTDPQKEFISLFDTTTPVGRIELPEQTFEVEIPEEVINYWFKDASEIAQKIANSEVLQLA